MDDDNCQQISDYNMEDDTVNENNITDSDSSEFGDIVETLNQFDEAMVTLDLEEIDDDGILVEEDDSCITFSNHNKAVFACDIHPSRDWCVTGGEDEMVYIWNIKTGVELASINMHSDTIIGVGFNYTGAYLATGDMKGQIYVHAVIVINANDDSTDIDMQADIENINNGGKHKNTNTKLIIEKLLLNIVWETMIGDMLWMRWHFAANILMAGFETGDVYIWHMPFGNCKVFSGSGNRCSAGKFSSDGKMVLTSYDDGLVKLWDIKTCCMITQISNHYTMAHSEGPVAVACHPTKPLFMSGGNNGEIIFTGINGPIAMVKTEGSVESICFSPSTDVYLAASGTLSGCLDIWDYKKYTLRVQASTDGAIIKIKWLNEWLLIVATVSGNLSFYDGRDGNRLFRLFGHQSNVYDFAYYPSKYLLLTVSEDTTCKIFALNYIENY